VADFFFCCELDGPIVRRRDDVESDLMEEVLDSWEQGGHRQLW
jgi:hypothetical protein